MTGRTVRMGKGFQSLRASSTLACLALLAGCDRAPDRMGARQAAERYCQKVYNTSVQDLRWDEQKWNYYFRCERPYQILEDNGVEK